MPLWSKSTLAGAENAIAAFGMRLREGRQRAGLSQMRLEQKSGVDQSLISRLELAKAPHASLERVVRLSQALGNDFPLGGCPHEHRCLYRPDWLPPIWEGHLPYQNRSDAVQDQMLPEANRATAIDLDGDDASVPDLDLGIDLQLSDLGFQVRTMPLSGADDPDDRAAIQTAMP